MAKHPKSSISRLIPWLISCRDFQRYIYRAVRACANGRVIFVYYPIDRRKGKQLFALRRYPDMKNEYADACRSFNTGRVVKTKLEDLPPIRRSGKLAAKNVSANIGFLKLISEEEGLASANEAAVLCGGPDPMTVEAVEKAAKRGQLIAVNDGHGNLLFPRWQFSGDGGVLPGLRETLGVLRQHPHFDDLLPFTFLLNATARMGGKRPLDLLRRATESNIRLVLQLAAEAAE